MKSWWVIVAGLALLQQSDKWRNPLEEFRWWPGGGKITLYTNDWCAACVRTQMLLRELKLPHESFDVELTVEGEEALEEHGDGPLPIILIDGQVLRGYQPEPLRKLAEQGKEEKDPFWDRLMNDPFTAQIKR
ncbi:glutaredoxin family protein [Gallaecimonas sp. GXIMD4217]|uniref:glutaredoxin family protein n=1 Tax=Gallaecimonas sp. GXIMD4217 TaxID=3131927 RepID=UPI00311B15E5